MSYEKTKEIPVIESDVFNDNHDAHFAIGAVAINTIVHPQYEREFAGAASLRASVYLDKGFIETNDLDENGTELDRDDERSVHFVVVERVAAASLARVVGNMRLIVKSDSDPLPIEKFYPEVFERGELPLGSVEVSRLISRHEDPRVQNILKWPLFIAGFKHVDEHKLGPAFGLLEPVLTDSLLRQHVPVTPLALAKYIEDIHVAKQPVEIDVPRLKQVILATGDQGINLKDGGFSYLDFGNRSMPKTVEETEAL